jgi:hypothetical protein
MSGVKTTTPIAPPIVYGPITITVPVPTFAPIPCTACSCSGVYIDYAGPGVPGGIAVPCKKCGGKGWCPAQ